MATNPYNLITLLFGLRARAIRADAQAESVTLSPKLLLTFLDLVEPYVPQESSREFQFTDETPDGLRHNTIVLPDSLRFGVLKDLSFDNRAAAVQRLRLQRWRGLDGQPIPESVLVGLVDAIAKDAAETA